MQTPLRSEDVSRAGDTLSPPVAWLVAQQGTVAARTRACWSAFGSRRDMGHRNGWFRSRSRPQQSSSIYICIQGSLCHAWDRAVKCLGGMCMMCVSRRAGVHIIKLVHGRTFLSSTHYTCTAPPTFEQDGHTSSAALYSSLPATASAQWASPP